MFGGMSLVESSPTMAPEGKGPPSRRLVPLLQAFL